jgi:glycosyltransferase involved in cell wall biosynthesis
LRQINDKFEVIVVDDGSSDKSVQIIKNLQKKWPHLRLFCLKRDKNRRLGYTRNFSIRKAKGKYILLHLDCDDLWEPFIYDFIVAYHQIEDAVNKPFYLAGEHIHIARRDFLIKHGPFINIYRGEDRELWGRLIEINAFIQLKHKLFFRRIPKTGLKYYTSTIFNTWDHMITDFRTGTSLLNFIHYEFKKRKRMGYELRLLRALLSLPAFLKARFMGRLKVQSHDPELIAKHRELSKASLSGILRRYNKKTNFAKFTSQKAIEIFS